MKQQQLLCLQSSYALLSNSDKKDLSLVSPPLLLYHSREVCFIQLSVEPGY